MGELGRDPGPWARDVFDRFMRADGDAVRPSFEVRRSIWAVRRWWAVLLIGGDEVDRVLCLSRWGARRRGARMVAAERARVASLIRLVEAELFGDAFGEVGLHD